MFINIWDDVIDQGATFYRVVTVYTDPAKKSPADLTSKTPRATLMLAKDGSHVADFGCAVLGTPTDGKIVWSMPRDTTATLDPTKLCIYNIDLDDSDGVTTDRAQEGQITVRRGQAHP